MANSLGRFSGSFDTSAPDVPKMSAFKKGLLWGAAFSLTAIVSAVLGAIAALVTPLSLKEENIFQKVAFPGAISSLVKESQGGWGGVLPPNLARPVNILVMGIDRVPKARAGTAEVFAGRSDTMLLVRFEPADNSVRMLSIPRDSRVRVLGVGSTKINEANVQGGPALAAQVIAQELDGVRIDRYVRITTDAFKEVIDLVGGVEVDVPEAMVYRDVTQKLEINLQPGWQILNGEQAEQFARFRNDKNGDIGRVQRQQILLKSLQKRLYSPLMLPKIPQALQIVQKHIDTNLSLEEMMALVQFGRGLEREKLQMVMLPGRFGGLREFADHRSYWVINREKSDRIMKEYFATGVRQEETLDNPYNLRIAVQNGTDINGLAARMARYLRKQGYTNVYVIKEPAPSLKTTEIIVQKGDFQAAKTLQNSWGIGRVESSSTGDLPSDLTIRLGTDVQFLLDSPQ
jgi:LCP family protein required for cell wall assembly